MDRRSFVRSACVGGCIGVAGCLGAFSDDAEWTFGTDLERTITVDDDAVYVNERTEHRESVIHALDRRTGEEEWSITIDGVPWGPWVTEGGRLIAALRVFPDDGDSQFYVRAIDTASGHQLWETRAFIGSGRPRIFPVADGEEVFFQEDEEIVAVDADSGDELRTYEMPSHVRTDSRRIDLHDDIVWGVIRKESGQPLLAGLSRGLDDVFWEWDTEGNGVETTIAGDEYLYALVDEGTGDPYRIAAVDSQTGEETWSVRKGTVAQLTYRRGDVYFLHSSASPSDNQWAIDCLEASTGEQRWSTTVEYQDVTADEEFVYLTNDRGKATALDGSDGSEVFETDLNAGMLGDDEGFERGVGDDGYLYAISDRGTLYAFDADDA
ncbi:outer membrane protein assembly factor BamB family protein [Halopiger goleimassiliensis]|uniref:outer membrane protein assembly factor BamB family protein n=1 Tax=Halopiger goleimassiliensis TaxID=1293048 RepID=UPI0006775A7F|nr:PQQ-binding-like beta-propeller repeat protein [Halopiger goleimassiliensis]